MSDYLADTPVLGRHYCPTCEPALDPTREIVWVQWCLIHAPEVRGDADAAMGPLPEGYTHGGTSDMDADTNRRWCAWLAGRDAGAG